MSDYIKREDAIRSIADHDDFKGERWMKEAWADYLIEDAKPADVAPVKHGKWKHERLPSTSGGTYAVVRCSECKSQFPMWETKYCPNCGARMDGDVDETD